MCPVRSVTYVSGRSPEQGCLKPKLERDRTDKGTVNLAGLAALARRTGRVQMGGMVAERLFNLLPPQMPLGVKYKLVEGLWHHVGPSSRHRIRVGVDANVAEVIELARSKIAEFVVNYKIPSNLENRFNWLAAGDVSVKQILLTHIQEVEKAIVVEAVRAQVPVMLEHLRSAGSQTGRLAQIVRVGKHELELLMDKTVTGVRMEDPSVPIRSVKQNGLNPYILFIAVFAATFIIFFIPRMLLWLFAH
jgi:hypothetical protein